MEISKVRYYAHHDVLNDTIIWSRDIESLQDIDCWDIGLYGVIETWVEYISDWDGGKRIYNTPLDTIPASMFFNKKEKEKALNSFYNI